MIADLIIGFLAAFIIFLPLISFIKRKKQNHMSCKTCKGDCRFCYTKNSGFKK